ncbi:ferritin-like domain-containing protein [Siminovitchia sp. FSL H7-0308]|uniref:Rubrerythrin n=1 Tax=Siminovitchia thermophila TaxID=1245522 RepID=A0ABS2R837_9BACI|nr:ferritin-like domain-containing protein [Siminovitchia thermophila]MBM7715808.1 rubrerythrin [Siminovitchia thermophila]
MKSFTVDQGLLKEVARAVNGEYSAIQCYTKLIEMAPTKKEKKIITEIREDEIRHFHEFSALYMFLIKRQPVPEISEPCPDRYREGLRFAFENEQDTVDFYLHVADRANHPYMRHVFRRAAADEQNHAVWFLSLLTLM